MADRGKEGLSSVKWEGVWSGYAHKKISQVYWKFQRHMEREDLLSEAWLAFNTCVRKYIEDKDSVVTEPAHFMSLYKTALHRHFNRLALNLMSDATHHRQDEILRDDEDQEAQSLLDRVRDTTILRPDQVIALLNLPPACLKFLEAHLTDEGIKLLRQGSMFKRKRNAKRGDLFPRETTNEFYCRVAGADPEEVNIREEFRKALEE